MGPFGAPAIAVTPPLPHAERVGQRERAPRARAGGGGEAAVNVRELLHVRHALRQGKALVPVGALLHGEMGYTTGTRGRASRYGIR